MLPIPSRQRGLGGNASFSGPGTPSIRWIRRTVTCVIFLYVGVNLAARSPFGGRLLLSQQRPPPPGAGVEASMAAPWELVDVESAALGPLEGVDARSSSAAGSSSTSSRRQPDAPQEQRQPRRRPAAFEQCGRWQEAYMERHRKIVAGKLPERYLVAVLHDAGVADQLLGVVTAFYWALVRERERVEGRVDRRLLP